MTVIVSKIEWAVSPDHCQPYRRLTDHHPPYVPPEPPEPPNVDPHFFEVVLLVGSESGQNLDESLYHHFVASGGSAISTNAAFGSKSMNPLSEVSGGSGFPSYGAGDYNGIDEFNLSPTQMSEFTIEAWIYQTQVVDLSHPQTIVGRSFFGIQWAFLVQPAGDLRFAYQTLESGFGGNGKFTNILSNTGSATVQLNRWYHAAVTKDAAKHFRLFLDGVMVGKRTPNDATIDGARSIDDVAVGHVGLFGTNEWYGQVDELRITKGAARYRSDAGFPKPKRAWPRPPPTTTIKRSWENAESV